MAISTAIDASAVARVLGIQTVFKDRRAGSVLYLPQRIAVIGQGASASTYSTTKAQHTTATSVGSTYGYGSPLHLAAKRLMPANGDGVGTLPVTFYPLEDDDSGVASTGDITPSGSQTVAAAYQVSVNNILSESFVISVGDSVATIVTAMTEAINGTLEMPIIASDDTTKVTTTSKWKGVSANGIVIEIVGSTTAGTSFGITQHSGGLVNPDVDDALTQMGNVWETMVLNCLDIADTATLDKIQTVGEGRWGAIVRKPFVCFTGNTATTVSAAIAVPNARKTDYQNAQLVAPGSNDLPFVVAARQLARIAVLANNNPPHDYGSQDATGLTAGADGVQWAFSERDQAVKGGSSTTEVKDGVVNISDVVTFYHPTDEEPPAFRYVVDIVKLQNIIYNLSLEFNTAEWDGAPLIPDDQATVNPTAKKPKTARMAASAIVDALADEAILSDPETTKENIVAEIDSANPKRLNMVIPVSLSGNTNIKSFDLEFGFYFG